MSTHPIVTRAKASIFKLLERMNCHVTTTSPLPRSHVHALHDPNWKEAMYKARLVANGRSQQQVIDCDDTFSLVVKPTTIRTVLSLVVSHDWPIHQLHVKNAFLHGHLSETVYTHQTPGFFDPNKPDYVCHLQRSLYGLKQAPHAWFQRFASYATRRIIASLHSEFAMTDLGSLNYFLGISAQLLASGLFLSQSKFVDEILERPHMQNYNPCRTPVDTESKLGSDGDPVSDPTLYHNLAGALQYLTVTRPDLSYVVQQVCLYMHDPRDPYFTALKRILCYVCGTLDYGLQLHVSSTTQLSAYTDADWAGCLVTRQSASGYCVYLSDNILSWSAKRQVTLSRSSSETEYRGVANVLAESAWIRNFLCIDKARQPLVQILWWLVNNANMDYAELIWEEFKYKITSKKAKNMTKAEKLPYPSVIKTKVLAKGDPKGEPKYGMKIPDVMLSDKIKQSAAYRIYLTKCGDKKRSISSISTK
ncbi:ribonuclease H-like domain-containing protein [Tanacetum coccineum]